MVDSVSTKPLHAEEGNDLGLRLKFIREQNGLSQRELAKKAGVPHSNISMIEQGAHSPSINSLIKILSGIPMTLAHFFSCDLESVPRAVFRATDLKRAEKVNVAGVFEQTIPSQRPLPIEFKRVAFAPAFDSDKVTHFKRKTLSGYIISGQLEITVNAEVHLLNTGDAFSLADYQRYRLYNPSFSDECIAVLCEA